MNNQHYTDKEIYDMLRPKLMKNFPERDWSDEGNKGNPSYDTLHEMIALVYRSGYGRGQKGRDFMIGQHKDKYDPYEVVNKTPTYGDMVRMVKNLHEDMPQYYPPVGTVGTVTWNQLGEWTGDFAHPKTTTVWVQWPKGTTKGKGIWCVGYEDVEVVRWK